jgi:3-hydroxymyristoyl/3-hydroxydecanoyl-(acyl carrier protein) dehydratase
MDIPFICFNRKSIEKILPHRGAALKKIDGVFYSHSVPDILRGVKEINDNDQDLEGHFRAPPILGIRPE